MKLTKHWFYENSRTHLKPFRIKVDKTFYFLFESNGSCFILQIFKKNDFLFHKNLINHYDVSRNNEYHCPYCGYSGLNIGFDKPCPVLSEKVNEMIDYLKTKSNYRLKAIHELNGEIFPSNSSELFKLLGLV